MDSERYSGTAETRRVLVVCTGNSCRSILAEALINTLGCGRYHAVSAGSWPAGYVHPKALETLRRHGIDPGDPKSQSWDDFAEQDFDFVITVCDAAAAEPCPAFPGSFRRLHWSTPDPAKATGTADDIEAVAEKIQQRRKVDHEIQDTTELL
ncbi:MAG: arsenate reductase ArsC, partial [Woeseiaceae bacterium]